MAVLLRDAIASDCTASVARGFVGAGCPNDAA